MNNIGFKLDKEKKTCVIFLPKGRWFFVYSFCRWYPKDDSKDVSDNPFDAESDK